MQDAIGVEIKIGAIVCGFKCANTYPKQLGDPLVYLFYGRVFKIDEEKGYVFVEGFDGSDVRLEKQLGEILVLDINKCIDLLHHPKFRPDFSNILFFRVKHGCDKEIIKVSKYPLIASFTVTSIEKVTFNEYETLQFTSEDTALALDDSLASKCVPFSVLRSVYCWERDKLMTGSLIIGTKVDYSAYSDLEKNLKRKEFSLICKIKTADDIFDY